MNVNGKVDFNKLYDSNNSGKFKVIEDLGSKNHVHWIRIKFVETGFEKVVRYPDAMRGEVKDPKNYMAITITDKLYKSNSSGYFKIIKDLGTDYRGFRRVRIRFVETGFEKDVYLNSALSGQVKDQYRITVYGVGYLGDADTINKEDKMLYKIWTGMLSRCYNHKDTMYHCYGKIGVRVATRWHCFANFLYDAKRLPGYTNKFNYPDKYHLDKDYLQFCIPRENRVYSKDTCLWLYNKDNIYLAVADTTGGYVGVYGDHNNSFVTKTYSEGNLYSIGSFDNREAAANAFNITSNMLNNRNSFNFNNDVEPMISNDLVKHNLNPKTMCKIIN